MSLSNISSYLIPIGDEGSDGPWRQDINLPDTLAAATRTSLQIPVNDSASILEGKRHFSIARDLKTEDFTVGEGNSSGAG